MIVNFHPKEIESKKGKEVIESLSEGHQVFHVTDKSIEEWKAIVSSEEPLIFVTPMYWWGPGYEFDKFIQGVLSYGYAYEYQNGMPVGLLKGRPFELHMTHGTPIEYAEVMLDNVKLRMEKGIFGFCDAKVTVTFHQA